MRFGLMMIGATVLALAGCTAADAEPEVGNTQAATDAAASSDFDAHPISGLRLIDLSIDSGDQTHTFKTELADTRQAQARGLMFRTELADDEAMLFPSNPPAPRSFWMKNTPISLDIIFIGTDGRIANIAANTVPYSLESVPSDGITSAVLEIRGGLAAQLGIGSGDLVRYELD
ncbi:MAG: DUF192 domain-containing protein [Pseudomonadota bacterium]